MDLIQSQNENRNGFQKATNTLRNPNEYDKKTQKTLLPNNPLTPIIKIIANSVDCWTAFKITAKSPEQFVAGSVKSQSADSGW